MAADRLSFTLIASLRTTAGETGPGSARAGDGGCALGLRRRSYEQVGAHGLVRPRWRPASAASSVSGRTPRSPRFRHTSTFTATELTGKQTTDELVVNRAAHSYPYRRAT